LLNFYNQRGANTSVDSVITEIMAMQRGISNCASDMIQWDTSYISSENWANR